MTEKIKNCPFCGSPAELMCMPHCKNSYVVICCSTFCHASLGVYSNSRLEAIQNWNERIEEKEVKRLKQENKQLENKVDFYKHEYFSECDLREELEENNLAKEEYEYLVNMLELEKSKNIIHKSQQKYIEALNLMIKRIKKLKELINNE